MNDASGTVVRWDEQKGFGFIEPDSGGRPIFFHINDYSRGYKRPVINLKVNFIQSTDQKGRSCAREVMPVKGHKNNGRELRQKFFSTGLFAFFSLVLFYLFWSDRIPIEIVYLYALMSLLTFLMYAKDKYAAQNGKWRTSESSLHTLSLFGGWPGAKLAQSFLRHKSNKLPFLFTYWVTAILNGVFLYWLVTPKGSLWLRDILGKIHHLG
ncbi:MAG: DUF1294 domain-containing protein [Desulfobulbus sp.]